MDPNQNTDQQPQDLMIPPEDSLMKTAQTAEEVTYTPPKEWGGDQTAEVPKPTPIEIPLGQPEVLEASPTPPEPPKLTTTEIPAPLPSLTSEAQITPSPEFSPVMSLPPMPPLEAHPNPFLRASLLSLVLILIGVLVGILAARFVPLTPSPTVMEATPTPEITEEATPTATPILTPTATPSALLSLNWKMMTVNSPLTNFHSYRIYYPDTWSIKTYSNKPASGNTGTSTLILVKESATITILQKNQPIQYCTFPGDNLEGEGVVQLGDFHGLAKGDESFWRWAPRLNTTVPEYLVCGSEKSAAYIASTSIGIITLTGTDLDPQTLDEFNYLLEKIIILP